MREGQARGLQRPLQPGAYDGRAARQDMVRRADPEAAKLVVSQHLSGGKPVRRWVAKDKSAGGEKAGKKAKKAKKRAAKLAKKLRKAEKKVAKAERRALKHAGAITVPDATEAGVAM